LAIWRHAHGGVMSQLVQAPQLSTEFTGASLCGSPQSLPGKPMSKHKNLAGFTELTPCLKREVASVRRGGESAEIFGRDFVHYTGEFARLSRMPGQDAPPRRPAIIQHGDQ